MRHDPVRDEAERLVAAAVAAVSMAARNIPRTGSWAIATDSEECCVCPVCRVIATMREPSAEMTERLAAGAGELATAVAGVLRMLSRAGGADRHPAGADDESPARQGDEFWESMRARAADAARGAARDGGPAEVDPWRQATTAPATRPMAKKAVAKKAVAQKAVAQKSVAQKNVAQKNVAQKSVAQKSAAQKRVAKKADATAAAPPAADESISDEPPAPAVPAKKTVARKAVAKKAVKKAAPSAEQDSD